MSNEFEIDVHSFIRADPRHRAGRRLRDVAVEPAHSADHNGPAAGRYARAHASSDSNVNSDTDVRAHGNTDIGGNTGPDVTVYRLQRLLEFLYPYYRVLQKS